VTRGCREQALINEICSYSGGLEYTMGWGGSLCRVNTKNYSRIRDLKPVIGTGLPGAGEPVRIRKNLPMLKGKGTETSVLIEKESWGGGGAVCCYYLDSRD